MAIIATSESNGSNFKPVEAGTYVARCYSMIHIGTISENILGSIKVMNKVRITWELPTELKEFKQGDGDKPMVISKEFTLSMHEKATLRKFLESWRGKAFSEEEAKRFDITVLLGKPCMISVTHKTNQSGKTYAEIAGVSPVMKGLSVPNQINPNFEFTYDNFDIEIFNALPEFIQEKMKKSIEYSAVFQNQRYTEDQINQMHSEEYDKFVKATQGDDFSF